MLFAALFLLLLSQSAPAQTSAFNYNGRLANNGTAVNGSFQFEFKLFGVPAGGASLATLTDINATVADGVFNVNLDFGASVFDGNPRYLEIGVRPQGSGVAYTTFTTRQLLTSVPYTIRSSKAATAESLSCNGCVTDANVDSISGSKVTGTVANATNATNASSLGGQPASAYVLNGGGITANNFILTSNGQIVAPRMENLTADPEPAGPNNKGRIYYNTATNELRMSNGASWQVVGSHTTITNQVQPLRSPLQIATNAWWETPRPVTFSVGSGAKTFDGESINVAFTFRGDIQDSRGITKINTSSGASTGFLGFTEPQKPGLNFHALAFDGGNFWATTYNPAANTQSGLVYRVKANDGGTAGETEGGFPTPETFFYVGGNAGSIGILFDGESIWTTWTNGRVRKMKVDVRPTTAELVLCNIPGLISPTNLAFDGSNVWIIEDGSSIVKISKNCEANPAITRISADLRNPYAVAFDGANLWVTNQQLNKPNANSTVTKIRASDGVVLGNYEVGIQPRGLAFDGVNIWVANWRSNTVTKLRASDGSLVGTYPVTERPEAVMFDGLRIWVFGAVTMRF